MTDNLTLDSRGALQDFISEKAANDPAYREALIANPKAVLESHVGSKMPDEFNVKVVEEAPDTMYLIAPFVPPSETSELSDDDLEQVAGGFLGGILGGVGSALGGLFGGGGGGGGGKGGGGDVCERNYGSFNSQITISSSTLGDVEGR
jgi:hypothetical protein